MSTSRKDKNHRHQDRDIKAPLAKNNAARAGEEEQDPTQSQVVPNKPSVSLCTVTYNRQKLLPNLQQWIASQTYPHHLMEWVIIDDSDNGEPPFKAGDRLDIKTKVISLPQKIPLGEKRNLSHQHCLGEIIVYMDDDDYYPPTRVSHAVEQLTRSDKLIAGSSILPICFVPEMELWTAGPYGRNHATAGTFAFKRSLINEARYDDKKTFGEERSFLKDYKLPMIQLDPSHTIICIAHDRNTFEKRQLKAGGETPRFKRMPESEAAKIIRDLKDCLHSYEMLVLSAKHSESITSSTPTPSDTSSFRQAEAALPEPPASLDAQPQWPRVSRCAITREQVDLLPQLLRQIKAQAATQSQSKDANIRASDHKSNTGIALINPKETAPNLPFPAKGNNQELATGKPRKDADKASLERRRVIILAAGKGSRWNNYLGTPKHLVRVKDEPLVHRTQRLLAKKGFKDICVVCDPSKATDYLVSGSTYVSPAITNSGLFAHRFESSMYFWNQSGATILLYGDVFYTDSLLDAIASNPMNEWRVFGRSSKSDITGKPYGEIFAWSFLDVHADHLKASINVAKAYKENGLWHRCLGWEVYRIAIGALPWRHCVDRLHFHEWSDFTEDFDRPIDWDRWINKFTIDDTQRDLDAP